MKKIIKFSTYLCLRNSGNIDSDLDGLADWEELEIGTDPFKADTDGDGVKDGVQFRTQKIALELTMLKDMFIPHEGNGFKPMALHPGRILFHAGSALLLKMLLIGFIVAMPIEAWLAPDILVGQQQKIVELTNKVRQEKSVKPLRESSVLSRAAEAKVTDMVAANYFAHVSPGGKGLSDWLKYAGYHYAVAGENLAMGFVSADEVIEAWKESPTHYANLVDADYSQIGVAMANGKLEGEDTTVTAQYFAEPQIVQKAVAPTAVMSKNSKPTLEKTPVKLSVVERPIPDKKLVRAEVTLNPGTTKANIKIGKDVIELQPDGQTNEWSGSALLAQGPTIERATVPATLTTIDPINGELQADITAPALTVKSNFFNEYNYLKKNSLASSLWNFVSGYYIALLVMAIIAMLLNIFIEVRRQHPHLIVSTASLVVLLVVLVLI